MIKTICYKEICFRIHLEVVYLRKLNDMKICCLKCSLVIKKLCGDLNGDCLKFTDFNLLIITLVKFKYKPQPGHFQKKKLSNLLNFFYFYIIHFICARGGIGRHASLRG